MNRHTARWSTTLRQILTARTELAVLLLGFSSGLPLLLSSGTLQAWLTVSAVRTETIGLFALVGLPYTLKFLWAPLLDRYSLRWLGRRRSWMLLTQIAIVVVLLAFAGAHPQEHLAIIAVLAILLASFSATQDIAIDAWRTDTLAPAERGLGAAIFVTAYRVGMIIAGSFSLIVAHHWGWPITFVLMAALMGIGIFAALRAPEPDTAHLAPRTLTAAVIEPMREFFRRREAWLLIALVVLYKFSDAFASALSTTFLLRGAGFDLDTIGLINNGLGIVITLAGGLFGGVWMLRLGLYRALVVFGVLQAVTNLGYAALALWPSIGLMIPVVALEHFASGLGTAAFVALIMAACDLRYSATQFALLSALSSLGRVYLGPVSGYLVAAVGWAYYYEITFLSALPGLWLLWRLRPIIQQMDQPRIAENPS